MNALPQTPRSRTHRELIKRDLAAGKVVTQQTAATRHGCWRLASIIERIRRIDGWPVQTTIDPRDGHALYSLPKGWTPAPKPSKSPRTVYIDGVPDMLNGDTLDDDGEPL